MKKKLGKILVILGVISATVNLMSCANMSNVEVKQYAESESKKEEELNKEISKIKESKEDNRTETIIGGEEKALDKVRENKEDNRTETIIGGKEEAKDKKEETVGKEPETYEYTTNEKGEKVYRVYDEYLGEEVDNPELYKDEYYIGEGKGKKVPTYDTLADKWANYSDGVKKIIEKYDGKNVYEMYKSISKEEKKALAEAGLYLVGLNTYGKEEYLSKDVNGAGGNFQIMTYEEAERYALDFYNKNGGELQSVKLENGNEGVLMPISYNAGEFEDLDPCINASHLYTDTKRKEAYDSRQEFLLKFVLRNETAGSPAKYINALGGRQYFRDEVSGNIYTRDGAEWGASDRNGYNWCKNKGIEFNDYRDIEMIVFKKNNPDCKFGDLPMAYANTKYKTFHSGNGEPRWVERDVHAVVYDTYGYKLSPVLYKSIDKYLSKCGGIKINGEVIAFNGCYKAYDSNNKLGMFYYERALEGSEVESFLTDNVKENNNY